MMFDITLAVFLALSYSLFWFEISNHNKLIDELNVRLLHLERKWEEDKKRRFLVVDKTREMENRVRILEITKKR